MSQTITAAQLAALGGGALLTRRGKRARQPVSPAAEARAFGTAQRGHRICPDCATTCGVSERCPFCGGELQARSKYGNRRKVETPLVPGRTFDSQHEANVAGELVLRERKGEIRYLAFQVPVDLVVNGVKVCRYVADFTWWESRTIKVAPLMDDPLNCETTIWDVRVVGDAKGFKTPVYRLKKKLLKACHGLEVREL